MDQHELDKLLRDPRSLLELDKRDPRRAEALWQGLTPEQRLRAVLTVRGLERERLIVLAVDSRELVQAMAPDEFASTALELGPDDAGALIEMCSDQQLTYLLDLTGWLKESFAPQRYQVWLPLVLEAGVGRLQRWLASTDLEVLSLLFRHWLRVVKWLPSQEEQEPPDNLPTFTLDNVYYLDLRQEDSQGFVAQVLVLMKSEMPDLYGQVLESLLTELPAELGEYASRWRKGRMADHGFPDRQEALQLWAAPAPKESDWQKLAPKEPPALAGQLRSNANLSLLPDREQLPVLAAELQGPAREALLAELAYVANCGVAALEADPASPAEVARAARESLGLVNLGLGVLSAGDQGRARSILARLSLAALARQGAAALRRLNRRAWALLKEGWLKDMPTGLHVLDHPLDRWLAGLVFPRPRCFDPKLPDGREYRSFLSLADLEAAEVHLSQAEFWGQLLFKLLAIDPRQAAALFGEPFLPVEAEDIKLSHVLGTWLARRALGTPGLEPIPLAKLPQAVDALQQGLAGELAREVERSLQALSDPAQVQLARRSLNGVLAALKRDLGRLDLKGELDPRFVGGLVLAR